MNRYLLIILIALVALCQYACADSLFYTGNVVVDTIEGRVVLGEVSDVTLNYLLTNRGNTEERVTLAYSRLPVSLKAQGSSITNPVVFAPGETKQFDVEFSMEMQDEVIRVFSLDPTLTFDGKANNALVGEYGIIMTMPAGTAALLTESTPHHAELLDTEGNVAYEWAFKETYPPVITVRWDSRGLDLLLTKSANPAVITKERETITVTVTVENRGSESVTDVFLIDEFVPSDFMAISPADEFILTEQNTSDTRLYWVGSLGEIQPGGTGTAVYQVSYTGEAKTIRTIELAPCMASVDDHLAGLSNPVTLTVLGDAVPVTPPATETPLQYPVMLTVAACAAGCMLFRRSIYRP